jgi:hypothetical protein
LALLGLVCVEAELCKFCMAIFPFPPCSLYGAPSFATEAPDTGMVSFVATDTIPGEGCLCDCRMDVGGFGVEGEDRGLLVGLGWFGTGADAVVTLGGLDGGGRASNGSRSATVDTAGLVS